MHFTYKTILSHRDAFNKLLADIEAIIDFVDEDLPINIKNSIKEQNKNIIQSIEKTIETSSVAN